MATAIPVIPEDAYEQILSEARAIDMSADSFSKVLDVIRKAHDLGINEGIAGAHKEILNCADFVAIRYRN